MLDHFDAALQAEIDRRQASFAHDAEQHQLARLAGRARAAAARLTRRPAPVAAPAPAAAPAAPAAARVPARV